MGRERRRHSRVGVTVDISVEAPGIQWQAKTVDLSPYGVKVALPANSVSLPVGTTVRLQLALLDQDPAATLTAKVVRVDQDGIALNFVNQGVYQFARLKEFVDSLLRSLSNGPAGLGVSISGLKDRRRSPRIDAQLEISL